MLDLSQAAAKTNAKDERVILGYWNPNGIVAKQGIVALKSKYGVPLYEDDPVHKMLMEVWAKGDPDKDISLQGYIRANVKKTPEDIPPFELA